MSLEFDKKIISTIRVEKSFNSTCNFIQYKIIFLDDYIRVKVMQMPFSCGIGLICDIVPYYNIVTFTRCSKEVRKYLLDKIIELEVRPTYILFDKVDGNIHKIFGDLLEEKYRFFNTNSTNECICYTVIPEQLKRFNNKEDANIKATK